ncbi:UDP-N-acetylglucosamine transporter isoform X1 [Diabrotica virgifera virgifera]|uniref:UDP-N-acetylglucosamine transporter-like isoform X1 n=2 Tax=Diabrotica virgifera virgifera TaxID=50390 RepID=A0A6P7FH58_DIAVI|nr:UDP-N-acetylglucosamine transporter isoform X1 [Diabrotica virgifera virgifera]
MMGSTRLRKNSSLVNNIRDKQPDIKIQKMTDTNSYLKYVSLLILTLQNAVFGLSMRYARTREGDMFLSSTAVLLMEVVKLITCLMIVYIDAGGLLKMFRLIDQQIIKQPVDTLKICVPSFVYLVQNNLLYLSASHLDAATYQVTYQIKILTTALFSVFILNRKLLRTQWISLFTLITGIVLVQLANTDDNTTSMQGMEQNRFIGFMAALTASCLSGFAGVYFEKMLKGSNVTVWIRNVQLSFCAIPFGLISCFLYDGAKIREQGFFFGYDKFILFLVLQQASGGLIVAVVVKYADNILKGFATALAIVISCIASIYIFDFQISFQFVAGAGFVIFSIFLYGYTPKKPDT